jgi:hypothetical protein
MTDHGDHDAEAAPTELASPPTTELRTAKHAKTPEEWSPDDIDEAYSPAPRSRYLQAGYATLLALMTGGLLISTYLSFFTSGSSKQAGAEAKPSTTVAVNAPPSAPTVAPSTAPAVNPTPGFSAYDEKFLSLMSHEGWGCIDNSGPEQCKTQLISFAHQICSYSGQPIDLIDLEISLPAFLGPGEERRAIANAGRAYPNCTFTESP